ncbi:farnesol dehydrogenase-like [Culicoides brevitarsis]|uniref:farnesol dehydrogenase-like n=1 Tax=Culicoides brevitarsis TaxID=469753 RepID=UPI00307C2E97
MDQWKGKIAVVTGASAGIGADIVKDLAKAGIHVVGLARRKTKIEEIAKEMSHAPGKIYAMECDVSNIDSVAKAFNEIEKKFKYVHILVNNAGRTKYGKFFDEKLPVDEIKSTIDINLTGLAACTRAAHKLMKKHEDPCYIININSVVGHMTPLPGFDMSNVYSATKHAVTNLTSTIRMELNGAGNRRIKVTSVSPGIVKTEFIEAAQIPSENWEAFKNEPALSGKDVSSTILYLLSTPAHLNVTELTVQPTGEKF